MRKIAIVMACFLYCLMPFDILPDFIPAIGQLDDIGAIIFAVKSVFTKSIGTK